MDDLLEENGLDIEAKEMLWEAISWTIEFGVSGLTLQRIMRDTSTCRENIRFSDEVCNLNPLDATDFQLHLYYIKTRGSSRLDIWKYTNYCYYSRPKTGNSCYGNSHN